MLERTKLRGGVTVTLSSRLQAKGFLVAFTERTGGTSPEPFSSLNLGFGRLGEDPRDDPERVRDNRLRTCLALEIDRFACAEQVHGIRMARVGPKRAEAGFGQPDSALPGADALVTGSRGVALGILTADCVPLALVDPDAGVIAAVHAGWRGVAGGILPVAVGAFDHPRKISAVLGPAVGPDHYQVGGDVALAVSAAATGGAVLENKGGVIRLDLPGTVARILKELSVRQVERFDGCTACLRRRFFSHRRDGVTGRQAMVVVRR